MANFILEQCSSLNTFIVGFGAVTPTTGETYSFSDGLTGETICGTVISGTASPTTYSAMTLYDNCHECIIDIRWFRHFLFETVAKIIVIK